MCYNIPMGENQTPSVPYSYKTLTTHKADQALNYTHKTDWLVQNLIAQPSLI